MIAFSGFAEAVGPLQTWNLLFARKPEPDLDFDDELEDPDEKPSRGYFPRKSKKGPSSPLLWIFLLVILGGGAYLAMEPDALLDLIGQWLGESPPMATMPPAKSASRPQPAPPGTPPPGPSSPQTTSPGPAASLLPPTPLFSQGQRVSVVPDPMPPGGSLSLNLDSAGTRPGPSVRAGTAVTVLDGELQNNVWVYSVRSEEGATGWIAEKHLRPKL